MSNSLPEFSVRALAESRRTQFLIALPPGGRYKYVFWAAVGAGNRILDRGTDTPVSQGLQM